MKKLIMFALLACLMLPVKADAQEMGIYVAPRLTYNFSSFDISNTFSHGFDKSDSVFGGAIAAGYDLSYMYNLPIRAELEYAFNAGLEDSHTWLSGDNYTSTTSLSSLFVNAYFDIQTGTSFTPYVGAGLGLAWVGFEVTRPNPTTAYSNFAENTDANFAWNIGLGVAYDFSSQFSVDLGYRYVSYGEGVTEAGYYNSVSGHVRTDNVGMNQFYLGARLTF